MAARAAVVCAVLAATSCHVFYVPPKWSVDADGELVVADTAFNWSYHREYIHRRVVDEAAGRRPPVSYVSWHDYWLSSWEEWITNPPKYMAYVAEWRRQAGLPDVDVRRGFGEYVDYQVRREAAGEALRTADTWDGYWHARIGKLWRIWTLPDAGLDEEELACRIVLRRRELGLAELLGPARECAGTLPPAAPLRRASEFDRQRERAYVAWKSAETTFADPAARALAEAARRGRVSAVDRLVVAGADVNASGGGGANPLLWANDNLPGFRRLLELGADPNVLYDIGTTVIHLVARSGGRPVFLEAALAHGGDPNVRDAWGETPLSADPLVMRLDAVATLLDAPGVDIEAPDRHGTTVAMKVAGVRDDILLALLERGADYEARNAAGYSVLDRLAFQRPLMFPGTTEARACDRVIAWLAVRGVELPEPRVRLPGSPSADWRTAR